ncbi:MAG TPA: aminoglycoside phosphotransferase family protein [Acidimicrobiia bacterium]
MQPLAVAERLARGGRIQQLTRGDRALGANQVYRLWTETGPRIFKVYGTPARERRERHALEALRELEGLPTLLDRGTDGDLHWALFEDAGKWSLGTLPENPGLARKGGEILRSLHDTAPAPMSNLSRGIDQDWVAVDFVSTFRRIERYRGRVGLSADLMERARTIRPPYAGEPRSSHTNTEPENFIVDDAGNVTLINWEWATLAPPEWDLSKAAWLVGLRAGPSAADALMAGYGRHLDAVQLDRWTVYHAGMMLVFEAENTLRTGGGNFEFLVAELHRAITGAQTDGD